MLVEQPSLSSAMKHPHVPQLIVAPLEAVCPPSASFDFAGEHGSLVGVMFVFEMTL
jgi:hypothetical protein